ncbi:MAG: Ig-like domain-containing protein [Pseudohongiellaceae bacterium]
MTPAASTGNTIEVAVVETRSAPSQSVGFIDSVEFIAATTLAFETDGSGSIIYQLTIDNDMMVGGGGTIVLTIAPEQHTGGSYIIGSPSMWTITIADAGVAAPATYTVAPASADEGDAMEFVVTRSEVVSGTAVSLSYLVNADGITSNAANAADFGGTFAGGTAMIAVGSTLGTITITATDDDDVEQDETFNLSVSVSGSQVGTATGTIVNDDSAGGTAPRLTVDVLGTGTGQVAVYELDFSGGLALDLTRGGVITDTTTFDFGADSSFSYIAIAHPDAGSTLSRNCAVVGSAATASIKAQVYASTVATALGVTTADLVANNACHQNLSEQPAVTADHTISFTFDAIVPIVSIRGGGDVVEGLNATFTITADMAPTAELEVAVTAANAKGEFLGANPTTMVTLAANVATWNVTVPTKDSTGGDGSMAEDGSITLMLDAGSGYMVSTTAGANIGTVTVQDVPVITIDWTSKARTTGPNAQNCAAAESTNKSGVCEGEAIIYTLTSTPPPAAAMQVEIGRCSAGGCDDLGLTSPYSYASGQGSSAGQNRIELMFAAGTATVTHEVELSNQYGAQDDGGYIVEIVCQDGSNGSGAGGTCPLHRDGRLSRGTGQQPYYFTDTAESPAVGPNDNDDSEAFANVRSVAAPELTVAADSATVNEGADADFTITSDKVPNHYNADRTALAGLPVTITVGDSGMSVMGTAPTMATVSGVSTSVAIDTQAGDAGDGTITLTLAAATATPPPYTVGTPSVATVTVSENASTKPTVALHNDSDSGTKGDNRTNDETPTITVGNVVVGGEVVVMATMGATTVSMSGTASATSIDITLPTLTSDGAWTVSATHSETGKNVATSDDRTVITIDTTAPTVGIAGANSLQVGTDTTITITFSDDPGTFTVADDITVTGGTLTSLQTSGLTRTATFTAGGSPTTANISVAAGRYMDAAGNPSTASNTLAITVVEQPPTATPVIGVNTPTAGSMVNEGGAGSLTVSGTTVAGAAVTVTATSSAGGTQVTETATVTNTNWTVNLDISGLNDGDITITATAQAPNSALSAAATRMVELDTVATVAIGGPDNVTTEGMGTFTFTLSDAPASPSAFNDADITVSGSSGTLANITGSGTRYTGVFTANTTEGMVTITVRANAYTDAAGNMSTEDTHSFEVSTLPTTALTLDVPAAGAAVNAAGAAAFTISGTAAVSATVSIVIADTDNATDNVTAMATDAAWSVSTDLSSLSDGTLTITVTASLAGHNPRTVTRMVTLDATVPTITVAAGANTVTVEETTTVTFTFSEAPTGFDADDDITTVGGTLGALTGSGLVRTATFTPGNTANPDGGVSVAANAFTDAAGNSNTEGDSVAIAVTALPDTATPTFTAPAADDFVIPGNQASFTISGTADAGASVSISITDGTSTVTAADSGATWSVTPNLSGLMDGALTITATASEAGHNSATATVMVTKDTMVPMPTAMLPEGETSVEMNMTATITIVLGEAVTGFEVGDLMVDPRNAGTLSGLAPVAGTNNYTVTFTPGSSVIDAVTLSVDANAFTDAAGNANEAGDLVTFAVTTDMTPPTMTISSEGTETEIRINTDDTVTITFTSNEATTTFDDDGITLVLDPAGAGTLGTLTGSGTTYTATFTGVNAGTAMISVAAGAFTDAADNGNEASNTLRITIIDVDLQQVNANILPWVAAAINDENISMVQNRISDTLNNPHPSVSVSGLQIKGNSIGQFMASLARNPANENSQGGWENLSFLPSDFSFNVSLESQSPADNAGATGNTSTTGSGNFGNFISLPSLASNASADGGTFGNSDNNRTVSLWGRGYIRNLSVDDGGIKFDTDIKGAIVGFDIRSPGMVIGFGLSRANADSDFDTRSGGGTGIHETSITSIHPYFGLQLEEGGPHVWAALSLGKGDVNAATSDGRSSYSSDVDTQSLGLGGYSPIFSFSNENATTRIGVIGDGMFSHTSESDTADPGVSVHDGRIRVGFELRSERQAGSGGLFSSTAEITYRYDFGDTQSGTGIEIGGGLDYVLATGLKVDVDARTLLINDDLNDWGFSAGIAWVPGLNGRGLSLTFRPQWGTTASKAGTFWQSDMNYDRYTTPVGIASTAINGPGTNALGANGANALGINGTNGLGINGTSTNALGINNTNAATTTRRMATPDLSYALELKYGIALRQDKTLLQLFARNNAHSTTQTYNLGADLTLSEYLNMGYQATLQRQLQTQPQPTTSPHSFYIRYQRPL